MGTPAAQQLDVFLDELKKSIGVEATGDGELERAFRQAFSQLPDDSVALSDMKSARLPACRHLQTCYDNLATAEPHIRKLVASFKLIEPMLEWYNRKGLDSASSSFADSHANSVIVGPGALMPSTDVQIGVSVMAPHTTYPDHRHPPEEVYIALSHGQWRQNDGPWNEPGIGGLIYNPGNIVHSMRSGQAPLFAFWCLPLA